MQSDAISNLDNLKPFLVREWHCSARLSLSESRIFPAAYERWKTWRYVETFIIITVNSLVFLLFLNNFWCAIVWFSINQRFLVVVVIFTITTSSFLFISHRYHVGFWCIKSDNRGGKNVMRSFFIRTRKIWNTNEISKLHTITQNLIYAFPEHCAWVDYLQSRSWSQQGLQFLVCIRNPFLVTHLTCNLLRKKVSESRLTGFWIHLWTLLLNVLVC